MCYNWHFVKALLHFCYFVSRKTKKCEEPRRDYSWKSDGSRRKSSKDDIIPIQKDNIKLLRHNQKRPSWDWCSTIWSFMALISCATWCGCLALVYSVLAYTDHKAEDYRRAHRKRTCSWAWAIGGILFSIAICVICLVVRYAYWEQFMHWICEKIDLKPLALFHCDQIKS